jgi:hypothetical protein
MYTLPWLVKLGPAWFRRFLCKIAPHANIRELERIFFYLYNRDKEMFYNKKRTLAAGGDSVNGMIGQGKDIVSLLSMWIFLSFGFDLLICVTVQANEKLPPDQRLGDEELLPQMGQVVRFVVFRALITQI